MGWSARVDGTVRIGCLAHAPRGGDATDWVEVGFLLAFLFAALVGSLIGWQRPANPLGWLLLAMGGLVLLSAALDGYAYEALVASEDQLPGGVWARWAQNWIFVLGWGLGPILLLFLPDGRIPSRRWRPVVVAAVGLLAVGVIATAFTPGPIGETVPVKNPLGLAALSPFVTIVGWIASWGTAATAVAGIAALVMRWRGSTGRSRHQIAWLLLGVLGLLLLMAISTAAEALGAPEPFIGVLVAVALCCLPAAIAVAILRENLLDIRLVLSRTVILAGISLLTLVTYGLALALASRWLSERADVAVSIIATVLVVLLLGSVKDRLEMWTEHRLFGPGQLDPGLAAGLAATVARHEDRSKVLREMAEQVRSGLGLAYVALEPDRRAGTAVGRRPEQTVSFPLRHQGQDLGVLTAGVRGDAPPDPGLIGAAASDVSSALWSLHLARELQRAREQLVRGRESERLRVRRDLHDGVGPVLAAAALQVDSLRRRIDPADQHGLQIADRVKGDLRRALDDVRSLIDGLRPAALDQLGLASAVQQHADSLAGTGLEVTLEAGPLPRLGPAAEVAAYRIVVEALTNVLKHARARSALVVLRLDDDGWLEVSVTDDGIGCPSPVPLGGGGTGVGLDSMRERAGELGGVLEVTGEPGVGTVVVARIPTEAS